jgi:hypothetical protein
VTNVHIDQDDFPLYFNELSAPGPDHPAGIEVGVAGVYIQFNHPDDAERFARDLLARIGRLPEPAV